MKNKTTYLGIARSIGILGTEALGGIIEIIEQELLDLTPLDAPDRLTENRNSRLWSLLDALEVEQDRIIGVE